MKAEFNSFFLALIFSGVLLFSQGCQEPECPPCINGRCVDENCECDALFEGEDCSTPITEKFLGNWQRGDICSSGSQAGASTVSLSNSSGRIRISSIGPESQTIFAEVEGDELKIPQQTYATASIQGLGAIDGNKQIITLDYNIDYQGGVVASCFTTLSR